MSTETIDSSPLRFTQSLFGSVDQDIYPICDRNVTFDGTNSWVIVNPKEDKSWKEIMRTAEDSVPSTLNHFAFVHTKPRKYSAIFIKNLLHFLKKHLATLKTIILHFRGALPSHPRKTQLDPSSQPLLPILAWEKGELNNLDYLYIGDPKFKITKCNKKDVATFLVQQQNIKHFALLGVDSEKTMHKILTQAIEDNGGDLPNTLYLDYTVGVRKGTPLEVLDAFSYYSHSAIYNIKKPREYEYTLMAKLVYDLKNSKAIQMKTPKQHIDFFWLTIRGWRCVEYIRESLMEGGHYAGAVFINKYTRQIVLASRGTVFLGSELGSIYADATSVALNMRNGAQHKAARRFLYRVLHKTLKQIHDINIAPRCVSKEYSAVVGGDYATGDFYNLSFTGHSLGGWLSEVLVAEACLEGYYTSSVTFDCPGSIKMVKQLLKCDISSIDCIQFVGSPNIVNALHGQVGEVRCILNTTPAAVENLQALDLAIWDWVDITRLRTLHAMDNFISAGSRYQKDLVAANHIGRWPHVDGFTFKSISPISIVQTCKSHLNYLSDKRLLDYFAARLAPNAGKLALESREVYQEISTRIKELSKSSQLRLLLPDFYSFNVVRLYPPAQKLVQMYSKLVILDQFDFLGFPENLKTIMQDITRLDNNRVFVKSGVDPNKIISSLNTASITNTSSRLLAQYATKMQEFSQVTIDDQFDSFKDFLFHNLLSRTSDEMDAFVNNYRTLTNGKSASHGIRDSVDVLPDLPDLLPPISHIRDLIALPLLPKMNYEQLQKQFSSGFSCLIQQAIEGTISVVGSLPPCEYSILALGSWGKECPLPYHHHKLLIIVPSQSSPIKNYFSAFCPYLVKKCKQLGIILESPLPSSGHTILFGTRNEIFCTFVLGTFPEVNLKIPTEDKDINTCLVRLCVLWDSNYIYGTIALAEGVKDLIMAIMHATDPISYRSRSRQFMQSFFQHIRAHITTPKPVEVSDAISIRQVYVHLLNLISYLSLFDKVYSTNPWERIREVIANGTVSERLGDQLLCSWNIVHAVYTRGQLKMKSFDVVVKMNESEPFLFQDNNEKEIFFLVKDYWLPDMAKSLSKFAKWLESFSPEEISPFFVDKLEPCFAVFYANQAVHLLSSLDNPSFTWSSIQSYCKKVRLHDVTNRLKSLKEEYRALDQGIIGSNVEKEEELFISLSTFMGKMNRASPLEYSSESIKEAFKRVLSLLVPLNTDSLFEHVESILLDWKNKCRKAYAQEKNNRIAEPILDRCYFSLLTTAIWKDHPTLLNDFREACVKNIHFRDLVFDCLRSCYSTWEELIFLPCKSTHAKRVIESIWDLPMNKSGIRRFPVHKEQLFVDHLHFISMEHLTDSPKEYVHITYLADLHGSPQIVLKRYLNEPVAAQFFLERYTRSKRFGVDITQKCHTFPLTLPRPHGAPDMPYTCTLLPTSMVPLALYSSLRNRISGSSLFPHLMRICLFENGKEKSYSALITKEIQERHDEEVEGLFDLQFSDRSLNKWASFQYTLKFLQSLVLLPQSFTEAFPLVSPDESKFFAFCSRDEIDASRYFYHEIALHRCHQAVLPCDMDAIHIFLSLTPYEVLQSWLCYIEAVGRSIFSFIPSQNPPFIMAMYHRFTLLQTILHKAETSLSHFDILKKVEPDVTFHLSNDRSFWNAFNVTTTSKYSLERTTSDAIDISFIKGQLAAIHDLYISVDRINRVLAASRETELFDTISSMIHGTEARSKLGHISSLAVHCYTVSCRPFEEEKKVIKLLSAARNLQQLSFTCIPHSPPTFIHKVVAKSFSTLIILDLSEVYRMKQTCLKHISLCSQLETLHLNQMSWNSFDCREITFPSLITLSLERCKQLTSVQLNVDHMPSLCSISFNDSFLFKSLQLFGIGNQRAPYMNISMLQTSISTTILSTMVRDYNKQGIKQILFNEVPDALLGDTLDILPFYLQVDPFIVKAYEALVPKTNAEKKNQAKAKKPSLLRGGTTVVAKLLGRNTLANVSDSTSVIFSGALWNAITVQLPAVVQETDESKSSYLFTLAESCKYMKMNQDRINTAMNITIGYMEVIRVGDTYYTALDSVLKNLLERKDFDTRTVIFRRLIELTGQEKQIIASFNKTHPQNIWQRTMRSPRFVNLYSSTESQKFL